MKLLKLNSKGFSHVEIGIVIVALILIAGAFYYVGSKQGEKSKEAAIQEALDSGELSENYEAPESIEDESGLEEAGSQLKAQNNEDKPTTEEQELEQL